MSRLLRSWTSVVAVVLVGVLVLGGFGTTNARATTSVGTVDFGMSVLAVNITSIVPLNKLDLFGPYYLISWWAYDSNDPSLPPAKDSRGDGSGCGPGSGNGPCTGNDFTYAFAADHYVYLYLNLSDNQLGYQPVNIAGGSSTWSLVIPGSRLQERTVEPRSSSGSSCGGSCRSATVTIDVTVQGLLEYQINNRYFWYQSWGDLAGVLNQGLTDYCLAQYKFTPQQQKALLATFILYAFLLPFSVYGYVMEERIMDVFIEGEHYAWDKYDASLQQYFDDSAQVGAKKDVFPANADLCNSWTQWAMFGNAPSKYVSKYPGGYGFDIQANMGTLDANLASVNVDIRANNVPQLISDLNTVAASINTAMASTRWMRYYINGTCGGGCADVQTSVLTPMQAYLASDATYNAGLVSALNAAANGMKIGTQLASSYAGGYTFLPATVNVRYDAYWTVTGGMPPQAYSWTLVSGNLPPGMGFGYGGSCAAWDFCGTPTTANTYTFNARLADGAGDTVTIPFTIVVSNPSYTLTASASNSGGTVTPTSGTYPSGTPVWVYASPASGNPFRQWTVDGVVQTGSTSCGGYPNCIQVTMNANHAVVAYFGYKLTLSGGNTQPGAGTYYYRAGTSVTITDNPTGTSYFKWFTVDGVQNTNNPITVTMSADHTVVAFEGKPPGGGGCVAFGTPILTNHGYVPVQSLKPGAPVMEYDFATQSLVAGTLVSASVTWVDQLVDINGGTLRLTLTDQPVYVLHDGSAGWLRDPQNLTVGDRMLDAVHNAWIPVWSVQIVQDHMRVYDVVTTEANNFVANGVLLDMKIQ